MILNPEVIADWKHQAQENKIPMAEIILALIEHIGEQNKILDLLERELEHRDYIDMQNENRSMRDYT